MEAIEEWIHKYLYYFIVDVRLVARLNWCSLWKMVIFYDQDKLFNLNFYFYINKNNKD